MNNFAQRQTLFGANLNMSYEVPNAFKNYANQCHFSLQTTPIDSTKYTCQQLQSYKADIAAYLGFEGILATQLVNQGSNQDFYNQIIALEYAKNVAEDFGLKITSCNLPITFTLPSSPNYTGSDLANVLPVPPLVCGKNNDYLQSLATYLKLTNTQLQQLQNSTPVQAYNMLNQLPNGQNAALNFAGYCHYCNNQIIGLPNQVPTPPSASNQFTQYATMLFQALQSNMPTATVNNQPLNTQQIFVILDQLENSKNITGYAEAWAQYVTQSGQTIITQFPQAPTDCQIGSYGTSIAEFLGVILPSSIYNASNQVMYNYLYELETQMGINHAASAAFSSYCTNCNQPA